LVVIILFKNINDVNIIVTNILCQRCHYTKIVQVFYDDKEKVLVPNGNNKQNNILFPKETYINLE